MKEILIIISSKYRRPVPNKIKKKNFKEKSQNLDDLENLLIKLTAETVS